MNARPIAPGEHPIVPADKDALLIEALRHAERVSLLLNQIDAAVLKRIKSDDDHSFDDLHELLLRRFSDCGGVHLFIAANNLRIDLPADLRGDEEAGGDQARCPDCGAEVPTIFEHVDGCPKEGENA